MNETDEFRDKVVLVTGGSRGIGRAVCERLAASGARVAVNYLRDAEAASATLAAIRAAGGDGAVYQADVADEAAFAAMLADVHRDLGTVEGLVANAGLLASEPPAEAKVETLQRLLRTNVEGVFVPMIACANAMMAGGGGAIVCIASVAALRPRPAIMAYAASKAAVISLVRSAAEGYGPKVRVNGVAPGFIDTDMTAPAGPAAHSAMAAEAALGRVGQPIDIAETVAFLLSSRASFVSGQTWVVDGGRIMVP